MCRSCRRQRRAPPAGSLVDVLFLFVDFECVFIVLVVIILVLVFIVVVEVVVVIIVLASQLQLAIAKERQRLAALRTGEGVTLVVVLGVYLVEIALWAACHTSSTAAPVRLPDDGEARPLCWAAFSSGKDKII